MVACISTERSPRETTSMSSKKASSSRSSRALKENHDAISEEKERDYQTLAQKLNNNAAMCIEIGYFDKATLSLQRALECYQKQSDENMTELCSCRKCEFDGNTDFSADFEDHPPRSISISSHDSEDIDEDEYPRQPKKSISKEDIKFLTKSISNPKLQKLMSDEKRRLKGNNAKWSIKDDFCEGELEDEDEDMIYKRPICVGRVGHPMGGSLFLIITFNLALTHHLEVAMPKSTKRYDPKSAQKALLFYELTSAHERRLLSDSSNRWYSLNSIRFNKILDNNLSQIVQYLPDSSLAAAHRLVSTVCDSVLEETERLSRTTGTTGTTRSSSRKSRSSSGKDRSRRSSNEKKKSRSLDLSDHSSKSMSRSSSKRGSLRSSRSGRSERSNSSSSRSRLENALGDMAPRSSKY